MRIFVQWQNKKPQVKHELGSNYSNIKRPFPLIVSSSASESLGLKRPVYDQMAIWSSVFIRKWMDGGKLSTGLKLMMLLRFGAEKELPTLKSEKSNISLMMPMAR